MPLFVPAGPTAADIRSAEMLPVFRKGVRGLPYVLVNGCERTGLCSGEWV